ncbi:lipopolysaccharide transport periplasmic protein LptA [Endozoicomonas sp. 8E]|uniref:lipopolysaccharide transport periplasmic protein LptA n=1 Tax=Endozoicomonas sp. 8E TaxID=3035692 RepID=UPI0029393F00|nr:lipopolysaccharide transport periplasmic protein LptA [Endozoicomonas sp. 8E]WOG29175.1 lipopolysaccharide transport periplasmic protein LptA [Endozoicomonas sp. 8E]
MSQSHEQAKRLHPNERPDRKSRRRGVEYYLILGATVLLPVMAQALPSDRQKPIEIESNTADIDNKKGVSIYKGNVVMIQGTTRITGDKVTIYSAQQEVKKIVAEGNQERAYYEEQQPDDQGTLQAWGHTIDYQVAGDKIQLIKQAQLTQKGDTFTGERIDYDLTKQTVNAKGSENKSNPDGRVKMIYQPKPESKQ